jgi:hypothetical protein
MKEKIYRVKDYICNNKMTKEIEKAVKNMGNITKKMKDWWTSQ